MVVRFLITEDSGKTITAIRSRYSDLAQYISGVVLRLEGEEPGYTLTN
jgi:hypothetical protein